MNKRNITIICGILTIFALVAAFVAGGAASIKKEPAQTPKTAPGITDKAFNEQAMPVEVVRVVHRPLTRMLNIPATLEAYEKADLYAKISGFVTKVNVDIGSYVQKGDVLMEVAVPEIADKLHQCEAILEAKQAREKLDEITAKRQEQLAADKAISQQGLDEALSQFAIAKADTKVAESEVARMRTLLEYAIITAPFDGVITARNFDPGAFVRSAADGQTQPLFALAKTDKIRLVIHVPEPDVPFVRAGTKVEMKIQCLNDEIVESTIMRTSMALNPNTRTMRAEVDLNNKNGQLTPGMYAQVSVKLEVKEDAMLIPSNAIRVRGRDISVLVSKDGIARSYDVEIGYDDGIWVEIVGGQLKDGDLIITSASNTVAPGSPIAAILQKESVALSDAF
ncbi:MAG: efflux RND transporter periplasmic adaptor subunit [Planctomycetes bacterium]|nr:efflux RND transporter periplasmic adaptor subunit [Planctomycetota bacterium]